MNQREDVQVQQDSHSPENEMLDSAIQAQDYIDANNFEPIMQEEEQKVLMMEQEEQQMVEEANVQEPTSSESDSYDNCVAKNLPTIEESEEQSSNSEEIKYDSESDKKSSKKSNKSSEDSRTAPNNGEQHNLIQKIYYSSGSKNLQQKQFASQESQINLNQCTSWEGMINQPRSNNYLQDIDVPHSNYQVIQRQRDAVPVIKATCQQPFDIHLLSQVREDVELAFRKPAEAVDPWHVYAQENGAFNAEAMRFRLINRRSILSKRLIQLEMSKFERDQCGRDLWVLGGLLDTNFSWTIIYEIKLQYKALGLVPSGYNYAKLWQVKTNTNQTV